MRTLEQIVRDVYEAGCESMYNGYGSGKAVNDAVEAIEAMINVRVSQATLNQTKKIQQMLHPAKEAKP